jgi:hypothetical protein
MNLEELQQSLENMSEQELSRFVKKCICQIRFGAETISDVDASVATDMVYAECARRGMEKLYDMAQESIAKHPEACNAA